MRDPILFFCILNRGKAKEVIKEWRNLGIMGGSAFLAEGTSGKRWLQWLGLAETQKDLLWVKIPHKWEEALYLRMEEKFSLRRKHRGIAFSIPVQTFSTQEVEKSPCSFDLSQFSYQCMVLIVDRNTGLDFVQTAQQAGIYGATLLHGQGAGAFQELLFPLQIEPKKDIVLFLLNSQDCKRMTNLFLENYALEKPGQGILFTLPVSRVSGLYEKHIGEVVR